MDYLQEQLSTQCSNISTELTIDYGEDFTTYEIFQSWYALINWALEVGKSQGFFIIIKRMCQKMEKIEGYALVVIEREHKKIEM